ncbi:hypothetical protein B0H19DRAFT_1068445 [Mycena capillaripes]|nr:hypothetical protein B0H19DRAFT_1068445 [Mycena capillaripes]
MATQAAFATILVTCDNSCRSGSTGCSLRCRRRKPTEQTRELSASSAKFQSADDEEHRPFGYVVRMKNHTPEYVRMRDMVPVSLASGPPRNSNSAREAYDARRDAFVRRIATSPEPELMQKHPWKCFSCEQPATAWIRPCLISRRLRAAELREGEKVWLDYEGCDGQGGERRSQDFWRKGSSDQNTSPI